MKKLFSPITLRSMTLANRIVLPAMVTRLSGEDGFVNQAIHDRYLRYAQGEVGLIVVEAMAVHQSKSGPLLRLGEDRFIAKQREMVSEIHNSSPSKVAPQIIHFLKIARSGWRQTVDMLELGEIDTIVQNYADAAYRACEAGYDGVELHMAHAYTLSSFLSRRNPRRDDYGGSLENRLRLPLRVIEAVRRSIGEEFPLGVRFDGEECIKDGYTAEESKLMALSFAQGSVDYISISAGGKFEDAVKRGDDPLYPYTGYSGDRCMPPAHYPDGFNRPIAAAIKSFLRTQGVATPVLSAGKINTPEMAEEILASGEADLIGMARPLLADPDWPKKVREGHWDQVVRCCYANVCKALDENFKQVRCFLWPAKADHAPEPPSDIEAPVWPEGGAQLQVAWKRGKLELTWQHAESPHRYGYDIFRKRAGEAEFTRVTAVPAPLKRWFDTEAVSGLSAEYAIQAYDLAGQRSAMSEGVGC